MTATLTAAGGYRHASDPSTEQLFRAARAGDRRAREQLGVHYMPLARRVASRYWNSSLAPEDLTQVANLALVKAIDRFDPDQGRPFEAFAVPTMLGELRRHFRDNAWAVHVARGAKERSKAVQDATALLEREQGRPPSVPQLALYLELSEEQVLEALQVAQAYIASSLDAPAQGSDDAEVTLASTLGECDPGFARAETAMLVDEAVRGLSDRERRLLHLRFVEEHSQSRIGEELGVSQMQVSRLLRTTLLKLREQIGEPASSV